MEGVEIIELDLVKDDARGSIFEFQNRDAPRMLLIKRKKGSVSGGHYHTGKNPMKDPETLLFLEGEAEVILKNVKTKEESREIYKRPVLLKLDPYIYHEIRAVTDIIMIDMNSIEDDDDTIRGLELK